MSPITPPDYFPVSYPSELGNHDSLRALLNYRDRNPLERLALLEFPGENWRFAAAGLSLWMLGGAGGR